MTPPREEARRLLRLARRDRETFDLLLPLLQANLAALGFLAQQSVEKALKAVAVYLGGKNKSQSKGPAVKRGQSKGPGSIYLSGKK
jgi:HEPN domain-containing protein